MFVLLKCRHVTLLDKWRIFNNNISSTLMGLPKCYIVLSFVNVDLTLQGKTHMDLDLSIIEIPGKISG